MADQCCCGRYKPLDEPLVTNETLHEPYGEPGAFCGSVTTHELRELRALIDAIAEALGWHCGMDVELVTAAREAHADTERLDWLERNYADLTYAGVQAERVPGGSISEDYWKVDQGVCCLPSNWIEPLATEAVGLRPTIDRAKEQ